MYCCDWLGGWSEWDPMGSGWKSASLSEAQVKFRIQGSVQEGKSVLGRSIATRSVAIRASTAVLMPWAALREVRSIGVPNKNPTNHRLMMYSGRKEPWSVLHVSGWQIDADCSVNDSEHVRIFCGSVQSNTLRTGMSKLFSKFGLKKRYRLEAWGSLPSPTARSAATQNHPLARPGHLRPNRASRYSHNRQRQTLTRRRSIV